MFDVTDLRATIVPKSDQLNAEQLLSGPQTITITSVEVNDSAEQPLSIRFEGDGGRPYKPGKTMRKVLIFAWGQDGRDWPGRVMTLYNDPAVKFGGAEVGGIRISHLSDIERDLQVSLTATKGKKALHVIKRLTVVKVDHAALIKAAPTVDALKDAFATAYKSTKSAGPRSTYKAMYDTRMGELTVTAATKTFPEYAEAVITATGAEAAALELHESRGVLSPEQHEDLARLYRDSWT